MKKYTVTSVWFLLNLQKVIYFPTRKNNFLHVERKPLNIKWEWEMSKLDSFLVQTAVSHCEHWFAAKFCSDQHGGHVNISHTIDFRGQSGIYVYLSMLAIYRGVLFCFAHVYETSFFVGWGYEKGFLFSLIFTYIFLCMLLDISILICSWFFPNCINIAVLFNSEKPEIHKPQI